MQAEFANVRKEMQDEFENVRTEFANVRAEMRVLETRSVSTTTKSESR